MPSFNKVILMGNLTKDPELRYTPKGVSVTEFSLAVSRRFRQEEELKDEVCFIDIVVFGKQAENCNKHEVVALNVTFMPKRQEAPSETDDRYVDETPGEGN